ncbi:lipopolysaccharide biosynthesis protein [Selenomonas ruminantium]|uniref:Membrane protein involved in the export of O-antigen and teichoic acid n=1 Tax=Selenomonas ruminantium TaxID=971 RepID=A0A1H0TZA6_SELRU|nr:hypothetical protein [Selenomonas ruminantium]SDP58896.1 Membrane protein involved in the export of O-antigen and teichoic acid [Selenomonas ruminantium]
MKPNIFIKSIAKFYISPFVNFFVGIFAVYVTTRVFNPTIFGVISMFNMVTNVLMGISCLGFNEGFLRFYHEKINALGNGGLFRYCLSRSIVSWIFFSIIIIFFYREISNSLFHEENFEIIIFLILNTLSYVVLYRYMLNYHRITNQTFLYNFQQIVSNILAKLFVVVSCLGVISISHVLFYNTVGLFCFMLIMVVSYRSLIFGNDVKNKDYDFGDVRRFSIITWPTSIMYLFANLATPLIITLRLDASAVGIYTSTNLFASAINVLTSGFLSYWAVFIYKNYKTEQKFIKKVHDCVMFSTICIISLLLIFQHVAYMFIGAEFHDGRLFFTFVILETLFLFLGESTQYGISISKKVYQTTLIFAISIVIKLVGTWMILPYFGLVGAAVMAAFSATLRFGLLSWRGQKYYSTISNAWRTSLGVLLIWFLAVSNYLFNDKYLIEMFLVIFCLLIMGLIYRSYIKDLIMFGLTKVGRQ